MLTYNLEKFQEFEQEVVALWERHYEEIAHNKDKIPLDPNMEHYRLLSSVGVLVCVTVRDKGKLVGYSFMFVTPHLHYKSTVMAINDILYLAPEYRKGRTGIKLIAETERLVGELGAKKIMWHVKTDHNFGLILKRKGYACVEEMYSKMIGE